MAAPPLVTVFITTYNEVGFIRQAVQSVVSQQAPFEFGVVVLDDCSTDGTQTELIRLRDRHSGRITLRLGTKNVNSNGPLGEEIRACASEYVAVLDGDDYWLSPHKLRKQVACLDAHPDLALCFHDVAVCGPDGSLIDERYTSETQPRRMTVDDMWHANVIATCSALYRQRAIRDLPAWYEQIAYGDWALHVIAAEHGDVGYSDEILAAYRRHPGGLWSGLSTIDQIKGVIEFYEFMLGPFGARHGQRIRDAMSRHTRMLAEEQMRLGRSATEGS